MNLQERINNLETLKKNWEKYCKIVSGECFEKQNDLLKKIDNTLPFKDQQEKEHWLDVLFSYKFWEDFEELTNTIISREKKALENILTKYYDLALELARDTDFKTLYNAFKPFSSGWVDDINNFAKWWEDFSKNEQDKTDYLREYKETYNEDFDLAKITSKYYAFECCTMPWFYEDSKDGKGDLIECIFERFYDGLTKKEELELYLGIIKGILNK